MQLQNPVSGGAGAPLPRTSISPIPFKRDSQEVGGNVPLAVIALLLVLFAAWWWLRRQFKGGTLAVGGRRARILESHRLGPRSTLAVVEFAGQWHLIAQTDHTVTCLAQSPAAETP